MSYVFAKVFAKAICKSSKYDLIARKLVDTLLLRGADLTKSDYSTRCLSSSSSPSTNTNTLGLQLCTQATSFLCGEPARRLFWRVLAAALLVWLLLAMLVCSALDLAGVSRNRAHRGIATDWPEPSSNIFEQDAQACGHVARRVGVRCASERPSKRPTDDAVDPAHFADAKLVILVPARYEPTPRLSYSPVFLVDPNFGIPITVFSTSWSPAHSMSSSDSSESGSSGGSIETPPDVLHASAPGSAASFNAQPAAASSTSALQRACAGGCDGRDRHGHAYPRRTLEARFADHGCPRSHRSSLLRVAFAYPTIHGRLVHLQCQSLSSIPSILASRSPPPASARGCDAIGRRRAGAVAIGCRASAELRLSAGLRSQALAFLVTDDPVRGGQWPLAPPSKDSAGRRWRHPIYMHMLSHGIENAARAPRATGDGLRAPHARRGVRARHDSHILIARLYQH
ncbi:hypothetical protein DFH11DRAFT_1834068 [Phellopilus nigrolimitatus]|nr:hypothetical protein DFH11DRAFT_1834068 [Phellopilus nigrolimitatus]